MSRYARPSKIDRQRRRVVITREYTAYHHLFNLLRFLNAKLIARWLFRKPRVVAVVYRNGEFWKAEHRSNQDLLVVRVQKVKSEEEQKA